MLLLKQKTYFSPIFFACSLKKRWKRLPQDCYIPSLNIIKSPPWTPTHWGLSNSTKNIGRDLMVTEIFAWQGKQNKQLSFIVQWFQLTFSNFVYTISFHLLHNYVDKFSPFYCLKRNMKMCDPKVSPLSFPFHLFCLVVWEFACLSTWLSLLS